jgi:serine/threonine protein kinase
MIGRRLSHFRITAKLGEGGMGVVYRAEDETLRRPVALKVLPPELVANEERRLRFLREARAAAAVTHPNIATVYEVGEAPGESGQGPDIVFIAMELVEGKPLSALIGGRPLPVKGALRIGTEIAEGLARAHKAKVIHRDLKPVNVVIGEDGHAKILDFGLAKLLEPIRGGRIAGGGGRGAGGGGRGAGGAAGHGGADEDLSRLETLSGEMTREGRILGTASYMSPEQARGQAVDARSDIFSLGVTLYEMVTGRAPFQGKTATDVLSAVLRDEPAPASRHNDEVPRKLDEVIGKCLRKDPHERYQHADDVAVDLREVRRTAESGVQAVPPRRGISKRTAAIAAGAALLAAGIAAALHFTGRLPVGGGRSVSPGEPGSAGIDSLAVLPLRNLSGDPEQEYFADGMTEELIATLARIRALRVISSTSAMYYKGKQRPLREIAAELNVDALVEGSVMRSGDRVRVTAQLVEGATDRHLWAQSYERDLRDVLALQADVARAIAAEVEAALTPGEATRLAGTRPVDPEAYAHYLKGRHLYNRLTKQTFTQAIEEFQRAIVGDPGYAPAHARLAMTYLEMSCSNAFAALGERFWSKRSFTCRGWR